VASGEKTQGEETEWEFEHREMEPLTEFTEKDTEKRRKKEEGEEAAVLTAIAKRK
jgi:hypothetical protein